MNGFFVRKFRIFNILNIRLLHLGRIFVAFSRSGKVSPFSKIVIILCNKVRIFQSTRDLKFQTLKTVIRHRNVRKGSIICNNDDEMMDFLCTTL